MKTSLANLALALVGTIAGLFQAGCATSNHNIKHYRQTEPPIIVTVDGLTATGHDYAFIADAIRDSFKQCGAFASVTDIPKTGFHYRVDIMFNSITAGMESRSGSELGTRLASAATMGIAPFAATVATDVTVLVRKDGILLKEYRYNERKSYAENYFNFESSNALRKHSQYLVERIVDEMLKDQIAKI